LIVLGVLFPLLLHAQNVIPKVGISHSKAFRYTDDCNFLSHQMIFKPGLFAGIGMDFPLISNFYLQAEIIYIQKGHKLEEGNTIRSAYFKTQDYHLEFVELPLLVKWMVLDRKINLYVHSGVTVAYGLGGHVTSEMEIEYQSAWVRATSERQIRFNAFHEDRPNDLYLDKPFDVGVQLGVGSLLFKSLQLEIRFTHGLTEFQYMSSNYRGYNRSFQVGAGLPLNLVIGQFRPDNKSIREGGRAKAPRSRQRMQRRNAGNARHQLPLAYGSGNS
jgi:hypothetical protein